MVTEIKLSDDEYIASFEICDNNEDYSICNLAQKLTDDIMQVNKIFIDIDIYKSQMQEQDQRIAELEQELAELKEMSNLIWTDLFHLNNDNNEWTKSLNKYKQEAQAKLKEIQGNE